MRSLLALAAVFALACSSSDPALVPVIGTPEDLSSLTGEWVGTYESGGSGRGGSISFHLTDDPRGAHGDVVFVPRLDAVFSDASTRPQNPGAVVLAIEFVRVAAGEINGRIAAYPDPDEPQGTLETYFSGHIVGDRIDGTYVTYPTHGVGPRRGTWKVHRKKM